MLILSVLLLADMLLPTRHLVSRTLEARSWIGKLITVVALIVNFSFFSDVTLISPVDGKVRARYKTAEERKIKSIGKVLAIDAVKLAAANADRLQGDSILAIARPSLLLEDPIGHWAKITSDYIASGDLHDFALPALPKETRGTGDAMDQASTVAERLKQTVVSEEDANRMERKVGEAEWGLRSVVSQWLSKAEGKLLDHAWLQVESFVDGLAPGMGTLVRSYGGKITGELESRVISAAANHINRAWKAHAEELRLGTEPDFHI